MYSLRSSPILQGRMLWTFFVSDGTDGWACVQKDSIWDKTVGDWCIFCGLTHGEYQLKWLWSSAGVGFSLWEIYRIMPCFLKAIACDFRKWSHIIFWDCIVFICIINLEEHKCFWWCVYLTWRNWFLVTTKNILCSSCDFWVVVFSHKYANLRVVPNPWLLIWVSRHDVTRWLEPIVAIFIVFISIGFI